MSRRQHSRITFSVSLPLPAGVTQKKLTEGLKELLARVYGASCVIKLAGRETTYL